MPTEEWIVNNNHSQYYATIC